MLTKDGVPSQCAGHRDKRIFSMSSCRAFLKILTQLWGRIVEAIRAASSDGIP